MMEQMSKKMSPRVEVMGEIKKVMPKQKEGKYLDEISEEVRNEREVAKEIRKKELKEVEKVLRDKQVKFLATESELDEIKKSALLNRNTLSEFIRSAIWEKIGSLELKDIMFLPGISGVERAEEEDIKESLKDIKKRLRAISRLEKRALKRLSRLEIQERDIKNELKEIKKRLTGLEAKDNK